MSFYPGQKIVCINDDWADPRLFWIPPITPKKGSVYRFRDYLPTSCACCGGKYLQVEEIPVRFDPPGANVGWRATFFRPLEERSTDISIFKKLLVPARGKERVREDA